MGCRGSSGSFRWYSVCAHTRASGDHGEGWEDAAVMGDAFQSA